jgi:hypothetical protein
VQQSLRTLEAIHLASAEVLHREGLRIPFVTADARQANAGRAAGLDIVAVGLTSRATGATRRVSGR